MAECANCDREYDESRFEDDLIEAAEVESIEQINHPDGEAMREAVENFGGNLKKLCAACWWECAQAADDLHETSECSVCGCDYLESLVEDQMLELAGVESFNQLATPPSFEYDEALANSGGRDGALCAECWWKIRQASWKLVEEDEAKDEARAGAA